MASRTDLRSTAHQLRRDYAHLLSVPRIGQAPQAARPLAMAIEDARSRMLGPDPERRQLTFDLRR